MAPSSTARFTVKDNLRLLAFRSERLTKKPWKRSHDWLENHHVFNIGDASNSNGWCLLHCHVSFGKKSPPHVWGKRTQEWHLGNLGETPDSYNLVIGWPYKYITKPNDTVRISSSKDLLRFGRWSFILFWGPKTWQVPPKNPGVEKPNRNRMDLHLTICDIFIKGAPPSDSSLEP